MSPLVAAPCEIIQATAQSMIYCLIEATGSNGTGRIEGRDARRFHRRPRDRLVRGHYVFSGQRHFASTIFADQILIVGWRLSKEAWPPVGSLSATRCTNVSVLFLLFLWLALQLLLVSPRVSSCFLLAKKRDAPRDARPRVARPPPSPPTANRIELSG